ncbi:hypothetical protein NL676_031611 [Syzygium grande]|nr:hypothetical protein NL676_031611 [Syzygium grande]
MKGFQIGNRGGEGESWLAGLGQGPGGGCTARARPARGSAKERSDGAGGYMEGKRARWRAWNGMRRGSRGDAAQAHGTESRGVRSSIQGEGVWPQTAHRYRERATQVGGARPATTAWIIARPPSQLAGRSLAGGRGVQREAGRGRFGNVRRR